MTSSEDFAGVRFPSVESCNVVDLVTFFRDKFVKT
jgi:hypothetical protein